MKNNFDLLIEVFGDADIEVRAVLPDDKKEVVKDKNRYPFMAHKKATIKIAYIQKNGKQEYYSFSNPVPYKYDGATIPFRIGKGNMKLLIPAMFHDIMCEHKEKIGFNRYLSSLVFRDLLLKCKVNKVVAQVMFLAVDNFQKFQKDWKNVKKDENK